jgi:hypothetical protein
VTQPEFSAAEKAALDRYSLAPLPDGFSDRLLARLAAGDLPAISDIGGGPAPSRRTRGFSGPWARSGRIVGSTALFGMVAAAAAASGILGEPVYIPVVSEALARADIIAPVKPEKAKPKQLAAPKLPETVKAENPIVVPAKGTGAVKATLKQLRADPEFRALPPKQRRAIARAEMIELLRSGAVTRQEMQQAMDEMREEARPIIRARIEAQAARERAAETGNPLPPSADKNPAPSSDAKAERAAQAAELRERYRQATPEQRAEIRKRIRERIGKDQATPALPVEQPAEK